MRFKFPDVADFPENDAPTFPEDVVTDHLFQDQMKFKDDTRELKSLIEENMDLDADELKILQKQINRTVDAARLHFGLKQIATRSDILPSKAFMDLDEWGITTAQTDTALLRDMFAQRAKDLEGQPPKTGINQYDRGLTDNGPKAIKAVHKLLDGLGLLRAATKYRGGMNQVKVRSVTLHVSMPGDRHHFQQFQDCEKSTSLLNLHLDPKPGILKAIIYLSEVTSEDGPFKYVPGSHAWDYDEMERCFAWGNSVANYCHTPKHRRVANAFPKRFRGNAIVGRLIPDGTDLSNQLRKLEVPYHSNTANVMVFDPNYGFHRGGQCTTGKRINLQVVLK